MTLETLGRLQQGPIVCVLVLGPSAPDLELWRGEEWNESGHHRGLSAVLSAREGLCVSKGLIERGEKEMERRRKREMASVCPERAI